MASTFSVPLGPAWSGAVLGTSICASLSRLYGVPVLPEVFLLIATGLLAVLAVGWVSHRNPGFRQPYMAPWGLTVMSWVVLGGAWATVTGQWEWQLVAFITGLLPAWVVCLNQLRGFAGSPTFQWGLALVAPMVVAASGGQLLAAEILDGPARTAVLLAATGSMLLSLLTAVPVFARVYLAGLRGRLNLPAHLTGTAWIPLGVIGQSTTATQLLAGGGPLQAVAAVYGAVMLGLGVVLALWAARHFWPTVARWGTYSPAWWGTTFPVGTLSLGSHELGAATGTAWLEWVSIGWLALLLTHWSLAALRFLSRTSARRSSRRRRPGPVPPGSASDPTATRGIPRPGTPSAPRQASGPAPARA